MNVLLLENVVLVQVRVCLVPVHVPGIHKLVKNVALLVNNFLKFRTFVFVISDLIGNPEISLSH